MFFSGNSLSWRIAVAIKFVGVIVIIIGARSVKDFKDELETANWKIERVNEILMSYRIAFDLKFKADKTAEGIHRIPYDVFIKK